MNLRIWNRMCLSAVLAAGAIFLLGAPALRAEDHSVRTSELDQAVRVAAAKREKQVQTLKNFLFSEPARKVLKRAQLDSQKVEKAVASLNDAELARLAARAEKAQEDFRAGALSNQDLTYIVIAIGAALLVLILVAAN